MRQLGDSVANVRNELEVAVPKMVQEGQADFAEPLRRRLTSFLELSGPRLADLGELKKGVCAKLGTTLTL